MKTWLKILIGLFLLGIIAGVLGYVFVYNKPHRDFAAAKPEFNLTAAELYDAFINDPEGSNEKYSGKIIQIEGNLDNCEESGELVILVFTFDDGAFGPEGVRCTVLPEANEKAHSIHIGDFIKIKGLCTGFTGDVIMDKCSIVE
ncbi:MAG: hypothetical protein IH597_12820 [Bacteroidales bacterium]|nr:hypothetical protein [Bacteroidales bacterium]